MPWEIPKKISLLAVAFLFLFTFFNLILDAPCTYNVQCIIYILGPSLHFFFLGLWRGEGVQAWAVQSILAHTLFFWGWLVPEMVVMNSRSQIVGGGGGGGRAGHHVACFPLPPIESMLTRDLLKRCLRHPYVTCRENPPKNCWIELNWMNVGIETEARAMPFQGIHKLDFRYSVLRTWPPWPLCPWPA